MSGKSNDGYNLEPSINNSIPPAVHAKNIGVYIDSDLNFQHCINKKEFFSKNFVKPVAFSEICYEN